MGAMVIEKHLTLDRTMAALIIVPVLSQINLLRWYWVYATSRRQWAMESSGRRLASERIYPLRKSLVAARTINVGESFTAENITAKRPGIGISPMYWNVLIGRRATRTYAIDELIEW